MAKTSTIHVRIEPEIKEQVDNILTEIGISTTDAVNMFFRQVIRYQGIPLDLRIPNADTIAAMEEVEEMIRTGSGKAYSSVDEMIKELLADDE